MLKRIGAEESGEFKAVASGTLPSGQPVVVNADGTVSVVSETVVSQSIGSKVTYETTAAAGDASAVAYDTTNDKIVIFYKDAGDSNKGKAIVGTVSGQSISFGTAVSFYTATAVNYMVAIFDPSSEKVVCAFAESGNSFGRAVVGTVSGTSISFATSVSIEEVVFSHGGLAIDSTNNKIIFVYRGGSSSGSCKIGTISGTSLTFGSKVDYNSGNTTENEVAYDTANQKVVISYRDIGNSNYGTAIVGTVSGTSISFGSEVVFNSATTTSQGMVYDPNEQKVVIVYKDSGNSSYGTGIVGTVSGTSISFGSEFVFEEASANAMRIVYDTVAQLAVVFCRDEGESPSQGYLMPATISGSTLSYGTKTVFATNSLSEIDLVYDPDNEKSIVVYSDAGNSYYGTVQAFQPGYTSQNLTSENYIGMSRGVAVQTGSAASAGSPVVFESAEIDRTQTVFDSQNNKIVITFRDAGNSYYGTAIVGTVDNSDNSISFGTPVVVESATLGFFGTLSFDSSNNKVVVPYEIGSQGKVKIGTVSGTSISFGSAVNISDPGTSITTVFDSNSNKVAFLYNGTSNYTKSKVGTVSGTSISFGTEVNVASAEPAFTSGAFDSNANKVVFAYRRSVQGRAIVGTISGTDISFGTEAVFHNTNAQQTSTTFDTSSNKIVISYQDYSASPRAGNAVVGTVSGTDISFGSPVTFNTTIAEDTAIVFDSSVNKVIIFYDDADNSNYGTAISGTVSGTTVSFDSETVFESASVEKISAAFDSNANRAVVAYEDVGNSQYGTAAVFNPTTIATTRGQVTNGQAASVDIIGSVSDNQIGLTAGQQYFVQTDGTISTTAGDPSVLAGTAISATELVVKT